MTKTAKFLLIFALVLTLVGILVAGIAFSVGGSFDRLQNRMVTHSVEGDFRNIDLATTSANLAVLPSPDGRCYALCPENDRLAYSLEIVGDTLILRENDHRAWYDYIGFSFTPESVTLYLPAEAYRAGTLKTAGGSIDFRTGDYTFDTVHLSSSSGKIETNASSTELTAKSNSGAIAIWDLAAAQITATTKSGRIELCNLSPETLTVNSTSGAILLLDSRPDKLTATSTSGRITLDTVVAKLSLHIKTTSGAIAIAESDAPDITLVSTSGAIRAAFFTSKLFEASSTSGRIDIPPSDPTGGRCSAKTTSGSIKLEVTPVY